VSASMPVGDAPWTDVIFNVMLVASPTNTSSTAAAVLLSAISPANSRSSRRVRIQSPLTNFGSTPHGFGAT